MLRPEQRVEALSQAMLQAKAAATELAGQLRRISRVRSALQTRVAAACGAGGCSVDEVGQGSPVNGVSATGVGGRGAPSAASISGALSGVLRSALGGELRQALKSVLSSLVRSVAQAVGRAAGGGLGGSLLSSIVGGGLSLLVGRLLRRKSVRIENIVQTEVLNFPRLSGLDFATNPASRLFGARAVPRGPAFTVVVDYKGGAEEIVTAKVAQKLLDLNTVQGVS